MTTITINDTPQAQDDLYTVATLNGMITEDGGTVTLSVMANDLGGKAKTMYSLDDGIENEGLATSADLLTRDVVGADNFSKSGALIEFTADGKVTYTMTQASTAKFQSLAEGEIGLDTFTYAIRLGNGTLSQATVTVQIKGTNDAPVITSMVQSGSVKEDASLTTTGKVTSTDVDNGATATYSGNAVGTYGSFAVTTAGEWTYTMDNANHQNLAEGETKTETFKVTVTDDKGATATQDVTITITGTNDAPVITSAAQSGSVKEDDTLTVTGTVASSDVDNGATATYSGNASGSYGSFAVAASTGVWTYTLDNAAAQAMAEGESRDETFAVTVTDDKGATATQNVVITITGTNDVPVITSTDQSGAVEEDGALIASGTVTSTDVDNGATATYSGNADGDYGSFAIDAATGEWTYTLDNDAAQSLNSDETVTETYTVTVTDDKGGIATQDVTVSINGKNEAPVVIVADESSAKEEAQEAKVEAKEEAQEAKVEAKEEAQEAKVEAKAADDAPVTTPDVDGPAVATVYDIAVNKNGVVTGTTSYQTDAAGHVTISGFDANDKLDVPTDWFLTNMVTQEGNGNNAYVQLSFDDVGGVVTNDYEITLTGISSFDASVQLV